MQLRPRIIKDCKEVEWYIILQRVLIEDVREHYLRGVPQSAHTPVDLYVTLGELLTLGEEVGGDVGVEKRVLRSVVSKPAVRYLLEAALSSRFDDATCNSSPTDLQTRHSHLHRLRWYQTDQAPLAGQ